MSGSQYPGHFVPPSGAGGAPQNFYATLPATGAPQSRVPTGAYPPAGHYVPQPQPSIYGAPIPATYAPAPQHQPGALAPLPFGWEERFDPTLQKTFYVDHNTQSTTWVHPASLAATAPPPSVHYAMPPSAAAAPRTVQQPASVYGVQQAFVPQQQQQQQQQQQPGGSQSMPLLQQQQQQQPQQFLPSLMNQQQQARLSLIEPLWDQKLASPGCSSCGKEFTFLLRRHRCRCCMRELCGTCSTKTHAVPQFGHSTPVRVCDACHAHLSAGRARCISRCIPYIERDSTTEAKRMEALGEVHELLMAGMELMEESKTIGMMGPLLHVATQPNASSSAAAIKALAIIALVTDLDETNCTQLAAVPDSIKRLVDALQSGNNNQSRALVAQILCAMARTKEIALRIVAADYIKPLNVVLSGQFADGKLVDYFTETMESLLNHDATMLAQLSVPHLLATLATGSAACQRHVLAVLSRFPPSALLQADGVPILVPLVKTHTAAVMPLLRNVAALPRGPEQLVRAGVLRQLGDGTEDDPLLLVLTLFDAEPLARLLFPFVCDLPNVGATLLQRRQLSRLTALLGDHYTEEYKLNALSVLSVLAATDGAALSSQMVQSGAFYDLINHMTLVGTSAMLQSAQLSVLNTILKLDAVALARSADSGAIQALFPLAVKGTSPAVKTLAWMCLALICEGNKDARVLLVAVASPAALVRAASEETDSLPVLRLLLQDGGDGSTRDELMQAGVFAQLMGMVASTALSKETRSAAGSCVAFCMQQHVAVDERYVESVAFLVHNDLAGGAPLLASFSAQPLYRSAILSRGLVPVLVALLSTAGTPVEVSIVRDCVTTLANLSYDEDGARVVFSDGGLAALLTLIAQCNDEQVRGLSVLCVGNVAQFPLTRQACVAAGSIEAVLHAYHNNNAATQQQQQLQQQQQQQQQQTDSKILDHYCMWALRMLVLEPGAAQRVVGLNLAKLAAQCTLAKDEHAMAFCASYMPWAVERAFADAAEMQLLVSGFPSQLIAPHLVRLLPRSAAALLLMCRHDIAAVHAAGAVAPLCDALHIPEACQALSLLSERYALPDLRFSDAAADALVAQYHNAPANVALALLAHLPQRALLSVADALMPVLLDGGGAAQPHGVTMLARYVRVPALRAQLLASATALPLLMCTLPPTINAADIVFRCCFDGAFAVAPELVEAFAKACVAAERDELVQLRGIEIAREMGFAVAGAFQNSLLRRLNEGNVRE